MDASQPDPASNSKMSSLNRTSEHSADVADGPGASANAGSTPSDQARLPEESAGRSACSSPVAPLSASELPSVADHELDEMPGMRSWMTGHPMGIQINGPPLPLAVGEKVAMASQQGSSVPSPSSHADGVMVPASLGASTAPCAEEQQETPATALALREIEEEDDDSSVCLDDDAVHRSGRCLPAPLVLSRSACQSWQELTRLTESEDESASYQQERRSSDAASASASCSSMLGRLRASSTHPWMLSDTTKNASAAGFPPSTSHSNRGLPYHTSAASCTLCRTSQNDPANLAEENTSRFVAPHHADVSRHEGQGRPVMVADMEAHEDDFGPNDRCGFLPCLLPLRALLMRRRHEAGAMKATEPEDRGSETDGSDDEMLRHSAWDAAAARSNGGLLAPMWCRVRWWVDLGNRWKVAVILLWILVGAAVAGGIFWASYQGYQTYRRPNLDQSCVRFARDVEDKMAGNLRQMQQLSSVISMFYFERRILDQDLFFRFTKSTDELRPYTSGLTFARFMPHSERGALEQSMGHCVFYPARFKPGTPPSERCERNYSEYLPIMLMVPPTRDDPVSNYTGQNILMLPFFAAAVEQLRQGADHAFATVDTNLSRNLFSSDKPTSYLLKVLPVFKSLPVQSGNQEPNPELAGVLIFGYNLSRLWDGTREETRHDTSSSASIAVDIMDMTITSDPRLLYRSSSHFDRNGFSKVVPIDVKDATRQFQITCRYTYSLPLPHLPIIWLMLGLLLVAFTAWVVWISCRHLSHVESNFYNMKLLKDKYKRAKQAADLASTAKGTFLATMSHELRTPLNGVIGMMNLLLETPLDATQLDYVETARTNGRALMDLINDILDLSKIEAGRMELESTPMSLRSEVDDVLSMFVEKIRSKPQLEVAAFVHESVPATVLGDPLRLRQVLMNLLSNSFKFTHKGHIFVCIRAAAKDEDLQQLHAATNPVMPGGTGGEATTLSGMEAVESCNSWQRMQHASESFSGWTGDGKVRLVISVEDTGEGIPFASQRSIFQPFVQADASTTRTHGGTGIGLSISRQLVQLMGGNLAFVSRPNVGTTFFFDVVLPFEEPCSEVSHVNLLMSPSLHYGLDLKHVSAVVLANRQIQKALLVSFLRNMGMEVQDSAWGLKAEGSELAEQHGGWKLNRNEAGNEEHSVVLVDAEWLQANGGVEGMWQHLDALTTRFNASSHALGERKPLSFLDPGSRLEKWRRILVANESEAESLAAPAAEFDAVLIKPVRHCSLAACLGQALMEPSAAIGHPSSRQQQVELIVEAEVLSTPAQGQVSLLLQDEGSGSQLARAESSLGAVGPKLDEGGRGLMQGMSGGSEPLLSSELQGKQGSTGWKKRQERSAAAEELTAALSGKKILVVDDNMVNRKVISKMLQRYGVEVEAVDGGAAAVQRLSQPHDFDCVFMDVQMPGMDGYEATKEVRRMEKGRPEKNEVLIVALTADIGLVTQHKCIEAGMNAFMTKPIEEDQLAKKLLPCCNGRSKKMG